MMLVLAVRTDPERVYRRALDYFTPDELAEAFAATRGVASPTQLRAFMKRDPRDLLARSVRSHRPGSRSRCSAGASGGWAWPSAMSRRHRHSRRRQRAARSAQRGTSGHTLRSAAPVTR